ncbi:TPT-domain-containing protein [Atractiella rhizophila]|nr:TPT-domain-containing protein [Atractiella rhizophila]
MAEVFDGPPPPPYSSVFSDPGRRFPHLQHSDYSYRPSQEPFFADHRPPLIPGLIDSKLSNVSWGERWAKVQLPELNAKTVKFVLLCLLWYASSAFSSNTGKAILNQFSFPVTLTFVQFAFVSGYCIILTALKDQHSRSHADWIMGIRRPTKAALEGTFIMCLFQVQGHIFGSMAIARIPVSTVHTIKALSPLFTVMSYALLFRVSYSPATYLSLLPLTVGVMLACSFQFRGNMTGLICALGSTLVFVSQNIFSKKLLPKEGRETGHGKMDKVTLLLFSSTMAFLLMIPIWVYTDGMTFFSLWWNNVPSSGEANVGRIMWYFFLNGSFHFAQNLLAFSILAITSPVTYSVASLIKRIVVICVAIMWFGQQVLGVQKVGIILTFTGLYLYNRAKGDVEKGERKRGHQERKSEIVLPTSVDDARELNWRG